MVRRLSRGVMSSIWKFFSVSFCLHALLSGVMFLHLRSVHDDTFFPIIFFAFTFLAYLNSLTVFPNAGGKRDWRHHLGFIDRQFRELSRYRKTCYRLAKQRGIAGWRWYAVPWMGVLFFLLSIGVSFGIDLLPVGLVVGMILWCAVFKWQTLREERWCAESGEIDRNFVHRRISQFLFFYPIPLLLFYGWVHFSVVDHSKDYFAIVFISYYSVSVFPSWLQLLLGQRTGSSRDRSLWKSINSYGCFGKVDHYSIRTGGRTTCTFLEFLPLAMAGVVILIVVKIGVHGLL